MIMYDSLNKRYLSPYGNNWMITPNFQRLASHTVTFDNFFGCSFPCMPARRELQTGRPNFRHSLLFVDRKVINGQQQVLMDMMEFINRVNRTLRIENG